MTTDNGRIDKRAAKAIIRRADGRALQLRRSESHPHIPLTPDIPGGTIDDGEDAVAALIREVREEVGLDVSTAHIQLFSEMVQQDEHLTASIALYEITDVDDNQEIVLSYEHDSYEWVELEDLKESGFYAMSVQKYVIAHTS